MEPEFDSDDAYARSEPGIVDSGCEISPVPGLFDGGFLVGWTKIQGWCLSHIREGGSLDSLRLWPTDAPLALGDSPQDIPLLTPFLAESKGARPAMVVCPGGGYSHLAEHEGEPVARWLNQLGISAFVLSYRLAPYRYPAALLDLKRAIRLIRHQANQFFIDPDRIGVLGFSAGGHLAGMVSNETNPGQVDPEDSVDGERFEPDLAVLCYAVTIFEGQFQHGILKTLLGKAPGEDMLHRCSLPAQVSNRTPPTFIWHTADDATVPVQHALFYAEALASHQVDFGLHVFEHGRHGLGLAAQDPDVGQWTAMCANWLKTRGFID